MRNVLVLRSPYVINNKTDNEYLFKIYEDNEEDAVIHILKPNTGIPIS